MGQQLLSIAKQFLSSPASAASGVLPLGNHRFRFRETPAQRALRLDRIFPAGDARGFPGRFFSVAGQSRRGYLEASELMPPDVQSVWKLSGVPVLMYHGIRSQADKEEPRDKYCVDENRFVSQLDRCARAALLVVSL